jgi:K(+)-stimulated pyrophosphate-energized sodium pump
VSSQLCIYIGRPIGDQIDEMGGSFMADPEIVILVPIAGVVALAFAGLLTRYVLRKDTGSPEMAAIGEAIREGAMAYLARQYKTIAIVSIILGVIIMALIEPRPWVGIAFLFGAFCSALSGYIGMYVSVKSNIRTASAARRTLNEALMTSFRGGAVSGFLVVALSLLGVAGVFYLYRLGLGFEINNALNGAVGYAFGASFSALFAQLGGGIYTKAADVGADLVGKVEAGIPEDDPRNPAVIADLVGDNVGDCAGRGADLFESTAAENIGAMLLGFSIWYALGADPNSPTLGFIFFPLVARSLGIFASIVGVLLVRLKSEAEEPVRALNRGYYVTCALAIIVFFIAAQQMLGENYIYFFGAGIIGIALSIAIVYITQYYTAGEWRPVKEIAEASKTGPATTIITGFSVALETALMPVIAIAISLVGAFYLGTLASPNESLSLFYGFYGTAVATMGMLATAAFILAEDTFGPITDNAGGIIEMSKQPEDIRRRTDRLDALGNTTKALTKGYAMASAGLAAFLLFGAYFERVAIIKEHLGEGAVVTPDSIARWFHVDITYPEVFMGAMIGGVLVFIFASLAIRAVGKAAGRMISEVQRQFKEIPGLMEGNAKPDYAKCVDIATAGALRAMVLPGILPVIVPLILGLGSAYLIGDLFGHPEGDVTYMVVGAMLMVGTIVGILLATMMNNGGGAWDNAKKYIEAGHYGGKKSPAHAAAVVGDTVGDPLKDTAGPSLHVLIKLLSTITLVFVSLFVIA